MSVSQKLITTHYLLRGTNSLKPVMPKLRENQILTLITKQSCIHSAITDYCSSTPCFQLQVTLLLILPLLRGDP